MTVLTPPSQTSTHSWIISISRDYIWITQSIVGHFRSNFLPQQLFCLKYGEYNKTLFWWSRVKLVDAPQSSIIPLPVLFKDILHVHHVCMGGSPGLNVAYLQNNTDSDISLHCQFWIKLAVRCCRRWGIAGGEQVPPSSIGLYFSILK